MFSKRDMKQDLQGHKTVKIHGHRFVIRKLNPLIDFNFQNMPQIFSSFVSRRKTEPEPADPSRMLEQMMAVVNAGIVEPELVPVGKGDKKGKEAGITVEDLFRDAEIGSKLYTEIMLHSMNRFRGLKGVFFSLKNRLKFYITLAKITGNFRQR